jgi:hypothetical protein
MEDEMSDFDHEMAEWRKTVWGTGPCQDSSQENFTLTDAEREAIEWAAKQMKYIRADNAAATLRSLLERLGGGR